LANHLFFPGLLRGHELLSANGLGRTGGTPVLLQCGLRRVALLVDNDRLQLDRDVGPLVEQAVALPKVLWLALTPQIAVAPVLLRTSSFGFGLTVFEESLHVVVVPQKLKDQGIGRVFKNQTQLQPQPDFIPVIAQFSQADAPVKMRLAEMPLGLGDPFADGPSLGCRHRANRLQEIGLDPNAFQAKVPRSNAPVNSG